MNIGVLAKETGMSPSRIRYYEALGLLGPVQRKANGYRLYAAHSRQALEIIMLAQQAGFTLDEIRDLLPAPDQMGWDKDKLVAGLRTRLAAIATLQAELARTHADLSGVLSGVLAWMATPIDDSVLAGDCYSNAEAVLATMK